MSNDFKHEKLIPTKYTCDGENVNPSLNISAVPETAVSLALVMEDPDVPLMARADGMWDHWLIWNMSPNTTHIGENSTPKGTYGVTTSNTLAYVGPCPPDREHRYFFKLFALDTMLDLAEGATKDELFEAMEGHILDTATIMGRYDRNQPFDLLTRPQKT